MDTITPITPQLYIFDLNGTLTGSFTDPATEWVPLPGRKSRLDLLGQQGHRIAIATNQGGVAFGHGSEAGWWVRMQALQRQLHIEEAYVAVCFGHPQSPNPFYAAPAAWARRKPSGAMLLECLAVARYPAPSTMLPKWHVCFIGDRAEDEAAAADAGVTFAWADAWFAAPFQPHLDLGGTP